MLPFPGPASGPDSPQSIADPYLADADVSVYCGDALDVLQGLTGESVNCCVTSPPYWGLRDYGTGDWDGGDPDCEHAGFGDNSAGGAETRAAQRRDRAERRVL